jgi:hypothetical protein
MGREPDTQAPDGLNGECVGDIVRRVALNQQQIGSGAVDYPAAVIESETAAGSLLQQ